MVVTFTICSEGLHFIARDPESDKPIGEYYFGPLTAACRKIVKTTTRDTALTSWVYMHSFHIFKQYRGRGYGTRLLSDAIDRADGLYSNVILQAVPYKDSPLETQSLIEFYKTAGFTTVSNTSRVHWMVRKV